MSMTRARQSGGPFLCVTPQEEKGCQARNYHCCSSHQSYEVTPCRSTLALALELAGAGNVAVYDGSWTEWASRGDLPIEAKD